ncbi:hypothetical protein SISNIDRAFT_122114 [Sistotremastrum niveocremeum HHB9708]|uniref:MFS general substrate transporter n=2 Tax=Sistotremastraceae TaxID=3402574 RepID=A0A164TS98_9AGAM|nr:hypothetical protein SISNIDRAFT_122114 [Sistotremastrum niveocremeum HHB9708]KZT42260.1 hypothetical protein SISSUDRAFT_117425 [Sistotremastrum suecicum HHB10207 ss-3]
MTTQQQSIPSPVLTASSETDPLLGPVRKIRKPWYRARPLWLVPFVVGASVTRGMTTAPRIEVLTQLACRAIDPIDYNHTSSVMDTRQALSYPQPFPVISPLSFSPRVSNITSLPSTPISIYSPSLKCLKDPKVQAGAARLQTVMTATMGTLSALTTGWWARFGERHGRTKVLAVAVFGLFLTDVTFVTVSTHQEALGSYGHQLLILGPALEGLLGGWSTLQGATISYISDCTSDGSRANIFSRFHGVFYVGFALGPALGTLIMKLYDETSDIFYVSAVIGCVNLILCCFVFPESLDSEKSRQRRASSTSVSSTSASLYENSGWLGVPMKFISPLFVFAPRTREHRKGKDWSLTLIALALFSYLLSLGIFQIRYLYATHTYSWGTAQLSYYVSFVGAARAVYLLLVLPYLIKTFKPTSDPTKRGTPAYDKTIAKEMHFDLTVAKCSLIIDMFSHSLVSLLDPSFERLFVAFSSMTSLGSGAVPSVHSLALCISQTYQDAGGPGAVFGALSMLQAVGSMIIGPLLFGLIFSETVAMFPRAIFAMAAVLLVISVSLMNFVRPSRRLEAMIREREELERGRSRVSKDLRSPQK